HYLKENISIVYGQCVNFPCDMPTVYEASVQTLRKRIGSDEGLLLKAGQSNQASMQSIASLLHSPPSISHLFAAGLWEDAKTKLMSVFAEWESMSRDSLIHADYLAEIYHTILSACFYYAHKNGQSISQALDC